MATTMKAAILHGREDIRIERVPVPEAAPGELIVSVGAALTCGTDLKVFRRGYHARMIVPPALFGHELAGTVVEAGEGVVGFVPGDRVVALNSAPCAVWPRVGRDGGRGGRRSGGFCSRRPGGGAELRALRALLLL